MKEIRVIKIPATPRFTKKEIFLSREASKVFIEVYYWAVNAYGVERIQSAYTYESDMNDLPIYLRSLGPAEILRIRRALISDDVIFITVKI